MWGQFGAGKKMVSLRMTEYQPRGVPEIALYGERFFTLAPYSKVTTDFNSDGTRTDHMAFNGKSDKLPVVLIGHVDMADREAGKPEPGKFDTDLPDLTPEQEDAVQDLTIRIGSEKPIRLPLSPAAGVWGALRTCTASLVKTWGFDPEQQAKLKTPPRPITDPQRWIVSDDYPDKALDKGMNGIVRLRLDIAADGTVEACHVQMQSKPQDFSAVTCANLLKRAKLSPALDTTGKPVRSFYVASVRWVAWLP